MNYKTKRMFKDEYPLAEVLRSGFSLKDVFIIPIFGQPTEFVVEHIRKIDDETEKIYFVAKDILVETELFRSMGQSQPPMIEANRILDYIEAGIPKEILNILEIINHQTSDGFKFKRKISLLSYKNLKVTGKQCIGEDDIAFDGLQTTRERLKWINGKVGAYWTCTPYEGELDSFIYVTEYGEFTVSYPDCISGIVPCFSIKREKGYKLRSTCSMDFPF